MVRAIASPRAAKGERTVFLPGATEAEPWEVWTTGAQARCLQTHASPKDASAGHDAVLALPMAQVIALPLWLQEIEPKQFRSMIALQLEAHGLQPRSREAIFDWSITAQEEARTLVLVAVLSSSLPEEFEISSFPAFELSARCFPLPSDALVLWTEQDRLVAAVTRGDRLAYFHAFSEGSLTPRVLQDLTCIVAGLEMQEVVGTLKQAVTWIPLSPAESSALQSIIGASVRQEPQPAPGLPRESWDLTPARVDEAKRQQIARRWQVRGLGLLFLLVVAAVAVLAARLLVTTNQVSQLRQWQASHAQSLQAIHNTSAAWKDLQPVLDTQSYPLEVLLHLSESLPTDQVHLTLFEEEGDHLLIKAEAKNLTAAFQFFEQLKKNPQLSAYAFAMAQPHSLANDITQIQIEGTHATHD